MADSDFVPVPVKGLVDRSYLGDRATLLSGDDALPEVAPGSPGFDHAMWADDESIEFPSTSHISIVDAYGNALSMTTTIENGFGSRMMTNGARRFTAIIASNSSRSTSWTGAFRAL